MYDDLVSFSKTKGSRYWDESDDREEVFGVEEAIVRVKTKEK